MSLRFETPTAVAEGSSAPLPGESERAATARGSLVALAAVIAAAFCLYGVLGYLVTTPRIFYDEIVYMEAADSLAAGHSPQVRERQYTYGPLYPAVVAPLLRAAPNREAGYELAKILNALLFALTAVPVYLLARRLLRPRPSVLVAALSVLVPSSVYVSVLMTESLSYLVASCALYAILLAVERPSTIRQLAALGTVVLAYLARPQFLALYVAYLLALACATALLPERRASWRAELRRLWPTLATLAAGVAAFVLLPVARGTSPTERLGQYRGLWRSYDVFTVAGWFVDHLAALDLYLAVVPFAIAPVVLSALFLRARDGANREGAFLSVFLSVNLVMLALVAVVVTYQVSSGSGVNRLHDRYVFYVVPLWLIVLFAWLEAGTPRPRVARRIGIVLAVVLAALLPLEKIDVNDGTKLFSAVGTGIPGIVGLIVDPHFLIGRLLLAALAAYLVALVFLPRRALQMSVAAVLMVFLVNAGLVWGQAFDPPAHRVWVGGHLSRLWVDEHVPAGSDVRMVSVDCGRYTLPRDSFFQTEFFNRSVGRVVQIDGDFPNGHIARDGRIVWDAGGPLSSTYVVTQPGLELRGRRVTRGTAAGLTLWRTTDGRVRVRGVSSNEALRHRACARA